MVCVISRADFQQKQVTGKFDLGAVSSGCDAPALLERSFNFFFLRAGALATSTPKKDG